MSLGTLAQHMGNADVGLGNQLVGRGGTAARCTMPHVVKTPSKNPLGRTKVLYLVREKSSPLRHAASEIPWKAKAFLAMFALSGSFMIEETGFPAI